MFASFLFHVFVHCNNITKQLYCHCGDIDLAAVKHRRIFKKEKKDMNLKSVCAYTHAQIHMHTSNKSS